MYDGEQELRRRQQVRITDAVWRTAVIENQKQRRALRELHRKAVEKQRREIKNWKPQRLRQGELWHI